jgi:hypothetical protein
MIIPQSVAKWLIIIIINSSSNSSSSIRQDAKH